MTGGEGVDAGGGPATATSTHAVLVARDITVSFGGVAAVTGASVSVAAGSCHGLVGPNGAGKTTMLNALSGVVRPNSGEIFLDGLPIIGLKAPQRRRHGLVRTFQNPSLVPDLSVIDNVKVGLFPVERWSSLRDVVNLGLARAGEHRTTSGAAAALDAVGFPASRRSLPAAELSHGDQKVVDLARALAGRPRVLLLDEPTAGLTVSEMDHFARVLRDQQRDHGATVLIVSHHMRFLSGLADWVTVMESGRVLAEGTFREISQDTAVVSAFLGDYDSTF